MTEYEGNYRQSAQMVGLQLSAGRADDGDRLIRGGSARAKSSSRRRCTSQRATTVRFGQSIAVRSPNALESELSGT